MPEVKVEGYGSFEVEEGTRLVRAMSQQGVDIGHRCGGQCRCTTCRVEFVEGEPDVMTRSEYEKLGQVNELGNFRLACQIVVDRPMTVRPLMTAEEMGWDDTGPEPAVEVEPEAEWHTIDELQRLEQVNNKE